VLYARDLPDFKMSNLTKATSEKNEHSNSFYHALKTKILEAEVSNRHTSEVSKKLINGIPI
jgi:hypothetical protein